MLALDEQHVLRKRLLAACEAHEFAYSLFGFLYRQLNIHGYRKSTSEHFREEIGIAILRIQMATSNLNTNVLECCGSEVSKLILCQRLCDSYPNNNYFKKLYFMSAFILEMISSCYRKSNATNLAEGPHLWIQIFQNNFASEFQANGGWEGLAEDGNRLCQMHIGEILPSETILPVLVEGIMASVEELVPNRRVESDVNMEEILEGMKRLNVGRIEIDLASGDEEAARVERPDEETGVNQPEEVGDRPSACSAALGGNVMQTGQPDAGTSETLGEGSSSSLGGRSLRKRRHDNPPKSDSDTEPSSLSPSKAKVDRK